MSTSIKECKDSAFFKINQRKIFVNIKTKSAKEQTL